MRWRKEKGVTEMLDEHLKKKYETQRMQLHQKKRAELYKMEKEDLPKDAIIIPRKNVKSFMFGMLTVLVIFGIVGGAFAVFNSGVALDMGSQKITSLATPTASTDAANKAYVDAAAAGNSKRIFITSTTSNGNMGGLSGANTICQNRANAAGIGGTWKAVLSTSTVNAVQQMGSGWTRVVNMKGETVIEIGRCNTTGPPGFCTFDGTNSLVTSVKYTETGATAGTSYAWVGTNTGGTYNGATCSDWTASSGLTGSGATGPPQSITTAGWASGGGSWDCGANILPIFCIEQ